MSTSPIDFATLNAWADQLLPVAEAAGRKIMEVQRGGFVVDSKSDASPVTIADRAAEAIVLETLETLTPRLPIVAEERVAEFGAPEFPGNDFWLIDALDGTREFVKRGSDFTVNIGLILSGVPVFGIVHAPARNETFIGITDGAQSRAERHADGAVHALAVRPRPAKVIISGSKSHEVPDAMNAFLADHDVAETVVIGSSLKFCLVAMGAADFYPRFGPTCEWDTAAGHAVVRAAGGRVHDFKGTELQYHKPKFLNGVFLVDNGISGAA